MSKTKQRLIKFFRPNYYAVQELIEENSALKSEVSDLKKSIYNLVRGSEAEKAAANLRWAITFKVDELWYSGDGTQDAPQGIINNTTCQDQ